VAGVMLATSLAANAASVLDKVQDRGVLRVGIAYTAPPMGYINDDGKWVGFDVDLAKAIADRLDVDLERVKVNDKTRIVFLSTGRVDISLAHMSHTRSRDRQVDFAEPPYLWTCKIFYSKRGRFDSISELGGKRVGVVQGSNAYLAAPKEVMARGGSKPKMVAFQKNADVFEALKKDRIDAYTQDTPIIAAVAGKAGVNFEAVGPCYSPGLYSIGVAPNDSRWRDKMSFVLQDMIKDGSYEEIYAKWFGSGGRFPLPVDAHPRLPESSFGDMRFVWPD
jgi:polar amino acid transport system substrate-binding protein